MRSGPVVVVCSLLLLAGCGGGSSNSSSTPTVKPPTANAGGPYTGTAGTAVSFSGAGSTDPQGETLTYAWNFGDNGTGTGVSPTHTYAAAGTYTVSLTVTNTSNLSATATSKATIAAAPPVANAGGPYTGTAGTAVSFSGAASSDPQGETLTYAWNFGDNGTGTGVSPTHTYAAAGTYTVSLTVTNTSNLTATATSKATIAVAALTDVAITGTVNGGSTPIVGAHVYLFAANTTGYGGAGIAASSSNASVSLLSASETGTSDSVGAYVATGSNGGFSLTGDYTCTSGQQLYLYALGGGNAAAGLMAAIGSCPASGSSAITATVNEVTTIAAAYAFAGFATDATHVSSSGTALAQVGIANAFANAANLASLSTGAALATTPAGNGTVPQTEINTLANILASCVETSGPGSNGCTLLFSNAMSGGSTGTTPTDTATAAINIAHHPGANISTLYGLTTAIFTPALTAVPNDFTVVLNFTGGGMGTPGSIAIDGSGNAWITNSPTYNTATYNIAELASNGADVSPSAGYSGSGLQVPRHIAVDPNNNVWVLNANSGISEFTNSGVPISVTTPYYIWSFPSAVAIDGYNNVWISNESNSFGYLLELNNNGVLISPQTGYTGGGMTYSGPIAIDSSNNIWALNTRSCSVSKFSNSGVAISGSSGYTLGGVCSVAVGLNDIAIDNSGDVWITVADTLAKLSSSGVPLSPSTGYTGGGLYIADGAYFSGRIAIDGSGNVWIADYVGTYFLTNSNVSISEFSNSGVAISPTTGYMVINPTPLSGAAITTPSIAIDGSGNVWLTCSVNSNVTEFIGAGTPVVTPLAVGVKNNTLGTRP